MLTGFADPGLPALPPRPADGHKGTFGTVLVAGGCAEPSGMMLGAPVLAARAAVRTGCGLVRLAMPAPLLPHARTMAPWATGVALPTGDDAALAPEAADVFERAASSAEGVVLGPGLGSGSGPSAVVRRLKDMPGTACVLDADALNAIASGSAEPRVGSRSILTPHPGEFQRLAAKFDIAASPIAPAERPEAARLLAERMLAVVVLKGPHTVVSDGVETWTCGHADAALAPGGTGAVMAGPIAGLWASTPDSITAYNAARIGVEAHARAAAIWRKTVGADAGLLATELCDRLPLALRSLH